MKSIYQVYYKNYNSIQAVLILCTLNDTVEWLKDTVYKVFTFNDVSGNISY